MKKQFQLPRKFAERWFKDLRSGEYKQVRNHLYVDNAYCCLGVACVPYMTVPFIDLKFDEGDIELSEPADVLSRAIDSFPNALMEVGNDYPLASMLSGLNDGLSKDAFNEQYDLSSFTFPIPLDIDDYKGYTFAQIADFIELNVELID